MDLEDLLIETSIRLASIARDAGQLEHPGLIGQTREDLFVKALGEHLIPARFAVGNGRVIGIDGELSNEADVIYYDFLNCPKFAGGAPAIFPSLGVHGIVEIKSRLDKSKLLDGLSKIAKFKRLYRKESYHPFGSRHVVRGLADPKPFGIIFAYGSEPSLEAIKSNVEQFDKTIQPDERAELIAVLDVGLVVRAVRTPNGDRPKVVFMSDCIPPDVTVIPAATKTLGIFYQMLSELLVSVPTFPVNPAMYGRIIMKVGDASVGGQVREIDATSRAKRTLNKAFLERIVEWVDSHEAIPLGEIESRVFKDRGDYEPLAQASTPFWLFDPENKIDGLAFPETPIDGLRMRRSLVSECRILTVNDRPVLVPRIYVRDADLDLVER
jgi:hypothetical protein